MAVIPVVAAVIRDDSGRVLLVRKRITDAFEAGVDFACSGAAFLSTSQKNMARAGMTLQFTRALWTKLQPGPSP